MGATVAAVAWVRKRLLENFLGSIEIRGKIQAGKKADLGFVYPLWSDYIPSNLFTKYR